MSSESGDETGGEETRQPAGTPRFGGVRTGGPKGKGITKQSILDDFAKDVQHAVDNDDANALQEAAKRLFSHSGRSRKILAEAACMRPSKLDMRDEALFVQEVQKRKYKICKKFKPATVVRAPRADITCPITTLAITDPVVAADGHTYERAAIEAWFRRKQTSPVTNLPITTTLYRNFALTAD